MNQGIPRKGATVEFADPLGYSGRGIVVKSQLRPHHAVLVFVEEITDRTDQSVVGRRVWLLGQHVTEVKGVRVRVLRARDSLFFAGRISDMSDALVEQPLSEIEDKLKKTFSKEKADKSRVPSTARASESSDRVDSLVLPDEMRARLPFTMDKYLVRENPQLVQWERETRKFLRRLSPRHGHRVAAVMIYEWATGIKIAELMAEGGSANRDLRKINQCLKFYFGRPYSTYIAGRKVPNAFRVRPGYYIKRHRPMTLTLYAEYCEGTLNP